MEAIGRAPFKQKEELGLGRASEAGGKDGRGCSWGRLGGTRRVGFKRPGAWYCRHVRESRRRRGDMERSRRMRPKEGSQN